jgi:uncharacterized DUF497 family protein
MSATSRSAGFDSNGRLLLLCYIPRSDGTRAISFRKTNKTEAKLYGKPQTIA